MNNPEVFLQTIHAVLGKNTRPINLHEPTLGETEIELLSECIQSTFVSSVGPMIKEFEKNLAEFTGSKHVIALVNGTSALQMALIASDLEPGSEILIPSLSFVATANAVIHAGHIPHFVDVDEINFGIDSKKLRTYLEINAEKTKKGLLNKVSGRMISAIIPMHTLGFPVAMNELIELSNDLNLLIIEDAAESLGSYHNGKHTGTFGKMGVLSFNGNKVITTGGGGAVLTDDDMAAERIRHLSTTAKQPHPWSFHHDELGWNFRMPNINAALGVAQFRQLPEFLDRKRSLALNYKEAFEQLDGHYMLWEQPNSKANFWLSAVRVCGNNTQQRDRLISVLHQEGFMVRPFWNELNKLPYLSHFPSAPTPSAGLLIDEVICLPSSSFLVSNDE